MVEAKAQDEAEALLTSVAAGSEAALRALLALYGRPLALFAGRYLGRPDMGEDVVQEVFLKVWREAGRFDPARGTARGWIWRIATNHCIDTARKQAVRRFIGIGGKAADAAEWVAEDGPGTERQIAGREELRLVRQALKDMPARQRMALLLTAVGGMDSKETAAIMGTSRGSVEQLLVRGRKTLRVRLGDEGEDHGRAG